MEAQTKQCGWARIDYYNSADDFHISYCQLQENHDGQHTTFVGGNPYSCIEGIWVPVYEIQVVR
jgi:hypothetical protein